MKSNQRFQSIEITDFSGGINKELFRTDIEDNQCQDILNFYFDNNNNLLTRPGCSKINTSPSSFSNRITTIFPALFGSIVNPIVLITTGSKVYRETDENTFIDISGSLKFPKDVFWSFKQFDDLVIGCNSALSGSGNTNPIKWDGQTATVEQLKDGTANAPSAKFCEVYNNRLWLVSSQSPNLIYYSKLGNPENFTESGGQIDINKDDGDQITGIYAHRSFLFIFKRRSIFRLVPGTPNTDPDQWSIEEFASNVGCVSNWTIQGILDDLVFLSDNGVVSLQAADTVSEFRQQTLSRVVPDLVKYIASVGDFNKFASVVNQDNSEYWISVPSFGTGSINGVVYVLDYKQIGQSKIRWTRFNGLTIGSSYASIIREGKFKIYIGSQDGNIYKYGDLSVKNDNGSSITNAIQTKAFNFGTKINRKTVESYSVTLANLTKGSTAFSIGCSYKFDNKNTLVKNDTISYTETLTGSVWGETTPSIGTWSILSNSDIYFTNKVTPDFGNKFIELEFTFSNTTINQHFILRGMSLFLEGITSKSSKNTT